MPLTPLLTHFAFSINDLKCTGMYWKLSQLLYWKIEIVLENVLECAGISLIILCGHPDYVYRRKLNCLSINQSHVRNITNLCLSQIAGEEN